MTAVDVLALLVVGAIGAAIAIGLDRRDQEAADLIEARLQEAQEYRYKYLLTIEAGQKLYQHLLDRLGEDDVEAWPAIRAWEEVALGGAQGG